MRPNSGSTKHTRSSVGLSESSNQSLSSSHVAQNARGSRGHCYDTNNEDFARIMQENQYLKLRLEQSKVLLRDITNAAKVNSSQLELMKTYKEKYDSMSKRLTEVEAAYMSETEHFKRLLSENQILQRQVSELTLINNTYCSALTDGKGKPAEATDPYTKTATSNPVSTASINYGSIRKDIQNQVVKGIESSLMQIISKGDLSIQQLSTVKKRSKSSSQMYLSHTKTEKTKSKTRSSSQKLQKAKNSSNPAKRRGDLPKEAHSKDAKSTNSAKVQTALLAKLQYKAEELAPTGDPHSSQQSSPTIFPMSDPPCKHPELFLSKAPESSFVTRGSSNTGSRGANCHDPSQSSGVFSMNASTPHSNPTTPLAHNLQLLRANTDSINAHVGDIYKSVDKPCIDADTAATKDFRELSESQDANASPKSLVVLATGNTIQTTEGSMQSTDQRIPEFYRQHVKTVTAPLLQTIADLELENETLRAVIESKDKEISILKGMLADMFIKAKETPAESIASTTTSLIHTPQAISESTTEQCGHSSGLLVETLSSSCLGKRSESAKFTAPCTTSGPRLNKSSLFTTDRNRVASATDYTLIKDMENVVGLSREMEKINQQLY